MSKIEEQAMKAMKTKEETVFEKFTDGKLTWYRVDVVNKGVAFNNVPLALGDYVHELEMKVKQLKEEK